MTMYRRPRTLVSILTLSLLALAVGSVTAQNRLLSGLASPKVYQLSPSGAKAGTTVRVVVAGRNLEDAERLAFSRPGITAKLVPAPVPEIDPKTKKAKPAKAGLPVDHFEFEVTVPANTPLGLCDVRVVNKFGVSNARAFMIGDLEEVAEVEPNNEDTKAQRIKLNSTVSGNFAGPQDVDYYVFAAAKGQRVVVSCLSASIDSRANPAVEVYDKDDKQLASNNNYRDTDALTDFTAPADGDYLVRVIQFTHTFRQPITGGMPAGSADHHYRLSVSTTPWIDAVHPNVIEPGKTAVVTVYGRNLPGGKLDSSALVDDSAVETMTFSVTAPADGKGKMTFSGMVGPAAGWLDGFELRLKNASGSSNPYLLGLATAPVVLDNGNNETADTAQAITLPCEIAGRIEKRRDRDWYVFEAKKGDVYTIRTISNRLGAPTYMTLLLRAAGAKGDIYESPLNENMQNYSSKFFSRSEDPPEYRLVVPADGKYQLLVSSRSGDTLFGPRHTYSVRITKEDADFRLVAMSASDSVPDSSTLPAGGQGGFSVLATHTNEGVGDIELSVEGLPPGVTCPPQTLNASVRKTTLILNAPAGTPDWAGEVRVKGTATINGVKVVREARAAGVIWPVQPDQNTPSQSRLEAAVWLGVRGKAVFTLTPTADKPQFAQGDKGTVKVKVTRVSAEVKSPIVVILTQPANRPGTELPANLRFNNNQPTTIAPAQAEATIALTVGPDVPPGVYNVVFRGQTQIAYSKDPLSKAKPNTPVVAFSSPLSIMVLPKTLATLTLSSAGPNVKIGGQTEVIVRVQRKYGFDGEFEVLVVLPAGAKGVEIAKVIIPAKQDEAKLVIKSPAGSMPGNVQNILVKATALYGAGKVPVVHEIKLGVNVVK